MRGILKRLPDRRAGRKKLSPEENAKSGERGTHLASILIGGEAITGILLAALFLAGTTPLTKLLTGLDAQPFVAPWGGWISLVAFAIISYVLIRVPIKKNSP